MANAKKNRAFDKVVINIPLVKNEPETIFVYHNDKPYEIKKGEDIEVPRYIYDMIVDNQEQNKRSINFINATKQ